ncbi:hypothetical protein PUN28_003353 [Cardiocondyla obscurior]|uniref:Uncharacterized protein n=1 Tax=Cardiocondyla obscurior TaxID=286306 RepID=A0AAW2GLE8_9HYME
MNKNSERQMRNWYTFAETKTKEKGSSGFVNANCVGHDVINCHGRWSQMHTWIVIIANHVGRDSTATLFHDICFALRDRRANQRARSFNYLNVL